MSLLFLSLLVFIQSVLGQQIGAPAVQPITCQTLSVNCTSGSCVLCCESSGCITTRLAFINCNCPSAVCRSLMLSWTNSNTLQGCCDAECTTFTNFSNTFNYGLALSRISNTKDVTPQNCAVNVYCYNGICASCCDGVCTTFRTLSTGNRASEPTSPHSASPGLITGVVLGAVCGLTVLLLVSLFLWRRKSRTEETF